MRPAEALRSVLALVLGISAFLTTAHLVRSTVEPAPASHVELAIRDLRQGPADVVFVGSSRIHRGIDPSIFDRETALRGRHTLAVNLGRPGVRAIEAHYVLRQLLADPPPNLDTIFFAPDTLRPLTEEENRGTERVIAWHDLQGTVLALRVLWDWPDLPLARRIDSTAAHLESWWSRTAAIGVAQPSVVDWWQRTQEARRSIADRKQARFEESRRQRGHVTLDQLLEQRPELVRDRRQLHLAQPNNFLRRVERAGSWDAKPFPEAPPVMLTILRDSQRRGQERGVEVVVLIPATTSAQVPGLRAAHAQLPSMRLIDLGSPNRHSKLYESQVWFDHAHLNREGAQLQTRILASEWLDRAAAHR